MIVVIDNYDSFTYNLVQALGAMGKDLCVFRNDQIDVDGVRQRDPEAIVISPGPGSPEQAGISNQIIRDFTGRIPILGVCLGHQCIGHVFGGRVTRAPRLVHGKTSRIYHDGKMLFQGVSNPFVATRYHSLIVQEEGLPRELEVTAHTSQGEIMGLRVRGTRTEGVQFHPESVLTVEGGKILRNFVDSIG